MTFGMALIAGGILWATQVPVHGHFWSALLNTSQQLGGAIGVAIASTVAATHLGTLLGQGKAANVALTGGFQWALWVCGSIALIAVPTTAALFRRPAAPAIPAATVAARTGAAR
jgi:hypothetical protein